MLGLIGTQNSSGLGTINRFFVKNLPIDVQLLIQHPVKGTDYILAPEKYVLASYRPTMDQLKAFLSFGVTTVIVVETPYNWDFLPYLKERGVKVVFIPMADSVGVTTLAAHRDWIDCVLAPTPDAFSLLKSVSWKRLEHLRMPVDTEYFKFKQRGLDGVSFLFNAGYDRDFRKGSDWVVRAYMAFEGKMKLFMRSQDRLPGLITEPWIEVTYGDYELEDMYLEGDVYLAPSRKEGVGLPVYEAMACGMPVIATDLRVWDFVMSYGWRVSTFPDFVAVIGDVMLAQDRVQAESINVRQAIEENFSWHCMRSSYMKLLESV